MTNSQKHILFVSHLADRSGAPLLLLEIIKYINRQNKFSCSLICMEDGPLIPAFSEHCKTSVWKRKFTIPRNRLLAKPFIVIAKVKQALHERSLLKSHLNAQLIFFNTIVNGRLQKKLSVLKCANICYVHELKAVIHMLTNEAERDTIFSKTDFFLCVSEAVRKNLAAEFAVPANKLTVVPSPVNEATVTKLTYGAFAETFRKKYSIGNAIVFGIAAGNEWRKGFDLLVPLATLYFKLYPQSDVYFVWKGFKKQAANAWFDLFDYDKCVYKERILLLPHDNDGLAQIASFDVHLLLSREDPYPLVVLEAANFEIPTVCFDDAGGAAEFVESDAGFIVPYADLYAMCEKLYLLSSDDDLRLKMGLQSREKLAVRHDKEQSLTVINDIICQYTSLQ